MAFDLHQCIECRLPAATTATTISTTSSSPANAPRRPSSPTAQSTLSQTMRSRHCVRRIKSFVSDLQTWRIATVSRFARCRSNSRRPKVQQRPPSSVHLSSRQRTPSSTRLAGGVKRSRRCRCTSNSTRDQSVSANQAHRQQRRTHSNTPTMPRSRRFTRAHQRQSRR